MTDHTEHLTLEEANNRLPLVKSIVQDITELYGDVAERRERLEDVRRVSKRKRDEDRETSVYDEEFDQMENDLERDSTQLHSLIEELEQVGAELEDPKTGRVDFLSHMDGREVYLCWQLGEDEITHWHELEAGPDDRHSLLEGTIAGPAGDDGLGDNGE